MFKFQCNIDKKDRINRSVIGSVLVIASIIGLSKFFFILLGLILVIEGIIGWCSIPYIIDKIQRKIS